MTDDIFTRIARRAVGEVALARPAIAPLFAPTPAVPRLMAADEATDSEGDIDSGPVRPVSRSVASAQEPSPVGRLQRGEPARASLVGPDAVEQHQQVERGPLGGRIGGESDPATLQPGTVRPSPAPYTVATPSNPIWDPAGRASQPAPPPAEVVRPNIMPAAIERQRAYQAPRDPAVPSPTSRQAQPVDPLRSRGDLPVDVRLREPDRMLSEPATRLRPSSEARLAEQPPAPPEIHIRIGRVEVRATTSAGPPPRSSPPERLSGPRLTLDEYLRQRNEGRR